MKKRLQTNLCEIIIRKLCKELRCARMTGILSYCYCCCLCVCVCEHNERMKNDNQHCGRNGARMKLYLVWGELNVKRYVPLTRNKKHFARKKFLDMKIVWTKLQIRVKSSLSARYSAEHGLDHELYWRRWFHGGQMKIRWLDVRNPEIIRVRMTFMCKLVWIMQNTEGSNETKEM